MVQSEFLADHSPDLYSANVQALCTYVCRYVGHADTCAENKALLLWFKQQVAFYGIELLVPDPTGFRLDWLPTNARVLIGVGRGGK